MPNIFNPEDPLEQQDTRQPILPTSAPGVMPQEAPSMVPPPTALPGPPPEEVSPQPQLGAESTGALEESLPNPPEREEPPLPQEEEAVSFWDLMPVTVYNPNRLLDPRSAAPRDIPLEEITRSLGTQANGAELLLRGPGELNNDPEVYQALGVADSYRTDQLRQAMQNYNNNIDEMFRNTRRQSVENQRPVGAGVTPDGAARIYPSTRNASYNLPMTQAARQAMEERPDSFFRFRGPFGAGSGWRRLLPWNLLKAQLNSSAFGLDVWRGLGAGLVADIREGGAISRGVASIGYRLSGQGITPPTQVPLELSQGPENRDQNIFLDTALRNSVALQDTLRSFEPVVDEQGRAVTQPLRGRFGSFGRGPLGGLLYLANIASPDSWFISGVTDISEVLSGAPYRGRIFDPLRGADVGFTQEYNSDLFPYATINNPYLERIRGGGRQTALGVALDVSTGLATGAAWDLLTTGARAIRPGIMRALYRSLGTTPSVVDGLDVVSNAAARSRLERIAPESPRWQEATPASARFTLAEPPTSPVDAARQVQFWTDAQQRAIANLRRPGQVGATNYQAVAGRVRAAQQRSARNALQNNGSVFITDTARVVEYPMLRMSTPITPTVSRQVVDLPTTEVGTLAERAGRRGDFLSEYVRSRGLQGSIVAQQLEEFVVTFWPARRAAYEAWQEALEQGRPGNVELGLLAEVSKLETETFTRLATEYRVSLDDFVTFNELASVYYKATNVDVYWLRPDNGVELVPAGTTSYVVPNTLVQSPVPNGMVVEGVSYSDFLETATPILERELLAPPPPRTAVPVLLRTNPELVSNELAERAWRTDEQLDAMLRVMGVIAPDAPPSNPYLLAAIRTEYGNAMSRFGPALDMQKLVASTKRVELLPADNVSGLGRVTYPLDRMPPTAPSTTREVAQLLSVFLTDPASSPVLPRTSRLPRQLPKPEVVNTLTGIVARMENGTKATTLSPQERSLLSSYGLGRGAYPASEDFGTRAKQAYQRLTDVYNSDPPRNITDPEQLYNRYLETAQRQAEYERALADNPVQAALAYVQRYADPSMRPDPDTLNPQIIQQAALTGLAEQHYTVLAQESAEATMVVEELAQQVARQYGRVQELGDYVPQSPAAELATRRANGMEVPNTDGPSPFAIEPPEVPASRMVIDVEAITVEDAFAPAPEGAVRSKRDPFNWLLLPPSTTPSIEQFAQAVVDGLTYTGARVPPNQRTLAGSVRALRQQYARELTPSQRTRLDELWTTYQGLLPKKPEAPAPQRRLAPVEVQQDIQKTKREIVRIIKEAGEEPPTSVRQGVRLLSELYRKSSPNSPIAQQIENLWASYGQYIPGELPTRPAQRPPLRLNARPSRRRRLTAEEEMVSPLDRPAQKPTAPESSTDIQPARTKPEAPASQPTVQYEKPTYYLVDVSAIEEPEVPRSAFTPEEIETVAQEILNSGQLLKPLPVDEVTPMTYRVTGDYLNYWGAVRAKELDPRGQEMVSSFVRKRVRTTQQTGTPKRAVAQGVLEPTPKPPEVEALQAPSTPERYRQSLVPPKPKDSFRTIASRPLYHGTKIQEGFDPMEALTATQLEFSLTNELGPGVYLTTNPERARTYALALRKPDVVPTAGTRYQGVGRVLEYAFDPDYLSKRQMIDGDTRLQSVPNNALLRQAAEAFVDVGAAALPKTYQEVGRRRLSTITLMRAPREWWYEYRRLWIRAYGQGNLVGYRDTLLRITDSFPERLQGFYTKLDDGHYDFVLFPGSREYGEMPLRRDSGPVGTGTVDEAIVARVVADTDAYQRNVNEITLTNQEYSLLRADTYNLDMAKAEETRALEELARARQELSSAEYNLEQLVTEERNTLRRAIEERAPANAEEVTRKFQPENNINNPCA